MNLQKKLPATNGRHEFFQPSDPSGLKEIGLDILRLEAGQNFEWNTGEFEVSFVSIEGDANLKVGDASYSLSRQSVFKEDATVICVGSGTPCSIMGHAPTLIAICKAKSQRKNFPPFQVQKKDVVSVVRGEGIYQRRVLTILGSDSGSDRIVLGETFNSPGGWSSFPPHKHDRDLPPIEASMEEIYFYKVAPSGGFGFQRIYTEDRSLDQAFTVVDNSAVAIPRGYHPVCAMPGHELYYLWFLAGKGRNLIPFTDPAFKWLEV